MKNKENMKKIQWKLMYSARVSDVKNDENTIFHHFEMKQEPKSSLKGFISYLIITSKSESVQQTKVTNPIN